LRAAHEEGGSNGSERQKRYPTADAHVPDTLACAGQLITTDAGPSLAPDGGGKLADSCGHRHQVWHWPIQALIRRNDGRATPRTRVRCRRKLPIRPSRCRPSSTLLSTASPILRNSAATC